jgi:alkanesulfonate monooxygenase SsuD/methylene tetrahydromethanopterin reductase-like flavin-dependent oxidoreductase (luciferase family)
MKFVFALTGLWQPSWENDIKLAQVAEDLGFWGFVVPDQYMWDPKDLGESSEKGIDATVDPWIALSYLAAETTNLRLGTWVTPLPLRNPVQFAKTVSSLDNISRGRAMVGIGAGATERMFDGYGEWDTDRLVRAKKSREAMGLILKLWSEDQVTFAGKYYHCKGAVLQPKPVQLPHPPLIFGGAGKIMLNLAGKHADICFIPPWTKLSFEDARKLVLKSARSAGRDKVPAFAYSFDGVLPPPYDTSTYFRRVQEAIEKGCDYFFVPFRYHKSKPWEETQSSEELPFLLNSMKDFTRNIMPSF